MSKSLKTPDVTIPHSHLHLFGERGHCVQIEKAQEFLRLVSDLLLGDAA